jgi:hypothetical protein
VKDKIIQDDCRGTEGIFVDISDLSRAPENRAGYAGSAILDKGVAAHPGDKGMQAIAERIYSALNRK